MISDFDWSAVFKMHVSMSVVLGIIFLFLLTLLYVWHKDSDSKVNLTDLICLDGKLDEKKFTRFGAWIVSTWGFIYLMIDNKFTEWYFTGYMAIWVGNVIVDKYVNNKNNENQRLVGEKNA